MCYLPERSTLVIRFNTLLRSTFALVSCTFAAGSTVSIGTRTSQSSYPLLGYGMISGVVSPRRRMRLRYSGRCGLLLSTCPKQAYRHVGHLVLISVELPERPERGVILPHRLARRCCRRTRVWVAITSPIGVLGDRIFRCTCLLHSFLGGC